MLITTVPSNLEKDLTILRVTKRDLFLIFSFTILTYCNSSKPHVETGVVGVPTLDLEWLPMCLLHGGQIRPLHLTLCVLLVISFLVISLGRRKLYL